MNQFLIGLLLTISLIFVNSNHNLNSIPSFAACIATQGDTIKHFLNVQTISFVILLQPNQSAWSALITRVMIQFEFSYSFNVFREPFFPQDDNLRALEREGFIIGGHVDRPFEINNAALWRRNGHYLILLADAQNEEQVVTWLRELWTHVGSVTVMTIFRGRLWAFRPFRRTVNGSFGQIEMLPGDGAYDANYSQLWLDLQDLNGYPLRLELFEAGYNIAIRNKAKKVQYFVGPDSETIAILQKKMNFTGD